MFLTPLVGGWAHKGIRYPLPVDERNSNLNKHCDHLLFLFLLSSFLFYIFFSRFFLAGEPAASSVSTELKAWEQAGGSAFFKAESHLEVVAKTKLPVVQPLLAHRKPIPFVSLPTSGITSPLFS